MADPIKPGWSRPSTILFACEFPANEKAFAFAMAQATEFGAELLIFHVSDSVDLPASAATAPRGNEFAAVRAAKLRLEPLAHRARELGIRSKIVVRLGRPADRILTFLRERKIDRVVMGAHSPGPIGKLLVGSVAEAVLRNANVPVCIVGPHVVEDSFRNLERRKILCDVSKQEASRVVANFGAELASSHIASLILYRVISPHERAEVLAGRTIDQLEAELPSLVPLPLQKSVGMRTKVAFGDPIEELLYQGRSQQANLIVLGAHGASQFAAVSRAGAMYKILAYAHCPVITMSPMVLAECGAEEIQPSSSEVHYLAGVI
jgi:nucleotide-binding universal stress UspA family protein